MNELKTLKDIKFYTGGWEEDGTISRCYFINGRELKIELKKEAIKWIKEFLNLRSINWSADFEFQDYSKRVAIIDWIKYFFNISDEEIK